MKINHLARQSLYSSIIFRLVGLTLAYVSTLMVQNLNAQPANDQCGGAIPLVNGVSYTINTASATSVGDPISSCSNLQKGVWFTYTPPASGTIEISTCLSKPDDFDTVLEVFTGTCGSLISVDCSDDQCGLQSKVTFIASATATYFILAGGYNGDTGTLSVLARSTAPPVNDQCSGAVVLTPGVTYSMSTLLATSRPDPTNICGTSIGKGVWFKVNIPPGPGGFASFSTCGSNFDARVEM